MLLGLLSSFSLAAPEATIDQVTFGELINDVEFSPDDFEGKVVVIERWGTRCPRCIEFFPEMVRLHRRYKDKGLVVIGMESQDSPKDVVLKVLKKARVEYPVVNNGDVPARSGFIPYALVFGVDGKMIWAGSPYKKEFQASIKEGLEAVKMVGKAGGGESRLNAPMIELREWTNIDGKTMKAEVLRLDGEKVYFRMDGSVFPYSLKELSDDDQKLIREVANGKDV